MLQNPPNVAALRILKMLRGSTLVLKYAKVLHAQCATYSAHPKCDTRAGASLQDALAGLGVFFPLYSQV